MAEKPIIFTVGHSTRTPEEFLEILLAHGVKRVADVRTVPRSRHTPQFNREGLGPFLAAHHIQYEHIPALGGLRHAKKNSVNTGWKNASFRGYADHMETEEFEKGLRELAESAKLTPTALMCAEAVPWRCHRSLLGDALEISGFEVLDIMDEKKAVPHRRTPFLKVRNGKPTYPADQQGALGFGGE